jgi:hypothetical protein
MTLHPTAYAYWECHVCHRIKSLSFPTIYSINRICSVPHGREAYYVVMTPLNDVARAFDEMEILQAREREEKRAVRENYLESWGWAPAAMRHGRYT